MTIQCANCFNTLQRPTIYEQGKDKIIVYCQFCKKPFTIDKQKYLKLINKEK